MTEKMKQTGESVEPQFEVNLPTEKLQAVLDDIFRNWQKLKVTVQRQQYDIPREQGTVELTSNVVTYVARK